MTSEENGSAAEWSDELRFLATPGSYPSAPRSVEIVETSMSWVFLTETEAFKIKKRLVYEGIDFADPGTRRRNAEEEVRLNRRLAPDIYLGVSSVTPEMRGGFVFDGDGPPVDWVVRMRRLPAAAMLDATIREGRLESAQVEAVAAMLAAFFAALPHVAIAPAEYAARFRQEIARSAAEIRELAAAEFGRPVVVIAERLERFIEDPASGLGERATHLVDAHGDLRPEHVCLTRPPAIIDCLEFSVPLRLRDPVDELAFLGMECERLGAPQIGPVLIDAYAAANGERPSPVLLAFYRGLRAFIRARIAIVHLRAPSRHAPEKWLVQTRDYLAIAAAEAARALDKPQQRATATL